MRKPLFISLLIAVAALQVRAELKTDVEFAKAGSVSLTLDAFVPEGDGPFPTCILVHGGGFTKGDKTSFIKPLFAPLSEARFAWFTINYRLAPDYRYPSCVEDAEAAIRWVRAHAKDYKVDPGRIALIGESAGGHIVSFVGTRAKGETALAAVVPFYGPHDLEFQADNRHAVGSSLTALLGISDELNEANRKVLREASPSTYVKGGMPPYLLIHGTKDDKVPYEQSVRFQKQMKAAGNVCDLITIPEGIHGMGGWEKLGSTYAKDMIEWLRKTMK